jgi:hypothetical protein
MFSTGINIFTLIFYIHGLLGVYIKRFGSEKYNFSRECKLIKKVKTVQRFKNFIYIKLI